MLENLVSFWWVLPIVLSLVFYKAILRLLFGMVFVPEDKIGLVTKKFVLFGENKTLPDGKIIALNGEAGYQAETLAAGIYFGYWAWQYEIKMEAFTTIPSGHIGLLIARDGRELESGRILARKVDCDSFQDAKAFLQNGGQKGKQVITLNTGSYRINTHLFTITPYPITVIKDGAVGIVTASDGEPLPKDQIAGKEITGHNNYQNFNTFLEEGGNRGLQTQVILAGQYSLNPWAVSVEQIVMVNIPIGFVGVVNSFVGEDGTDTSGENFKHGNIVNKGQKGVWSTALDAGRYPINTHIMKVELVPTTNLVLNWANARNESHALDQSLSTITVRSKDGFPFQLDVQQIIHIAATEAPKVIARFGNMNNLVSQVLEPTIGNYFRNSAQDADVITFLSKRNQQQNLAKSHIKQVLDDYNVAAVDTLIGDIVPPAELMKTLTDRKIAQEEEMTFETQQKAQEKKQSLKSATALADMQSEIVAAEQSVMIAKKKAEAKVQEADGDAKSMELRAAATAKQTKLNAEAEAFRISQHATADAERISKTGKAEAESIEAIGKSTAEAYKLQVEAMGGDNFAKFKITEEIGKNKIKIIPEILITGDGQNSNPISGLLGMEMLKQFQTNNTEKQPDIQISTVNGSPLADAISKLKK